MSTALLKPPAADIRDMAMRAYDFSGDHVRHWMDLTEAQKQHYLDFAEDIIERLIWRQRVALVGAKIAYTRRVHAALPEAAA